MYPHPDNKSKESSPRRDSFLANEARRLWSELGVETLPVARRRVPVKARATVITPGKAAPAARQGQFQTLEEIRTFVGNCERCRLCEQRQHLVFGSGNPKSRLLFVGEGPGPEEDEAGEPFVGKPGQLLTKIIEAMGHQRHEFYLTNVVKCRPPQNRAPQMDEIEQCGAFLRAQIEVIQPEVIISLGLAAASALTGNGGSMSNVRGRFYPLLWNPKILVMPTYHPAYLLRNASVKRLVWEDVKLVQKHLEEKR